MQSKRNRKYNDRKSCVKERKKIKFDKYSSCTEDIDADNYNNYNQDPYSERKYRNINDFLSVPINNEEISLCEESEKSKNENIYDPALFVDTNNLDDYTCGICEFIVDKPKALSCKCKEIYC